MAQNPPSGMPGITAYLFYSDVAGALEWLHKSFGFEKRMELPGPDGSIMHAEMDLGTGFIMLGPPSEEQQTRSPRDLPAVNQSLYAYVPDLNAHYERARSSGAEIVSEPEEMFWGDRIYSARDCEGHHWTFAQRVRDVPPEELKPA